MNPNQSDEERNNLSEVNDETDVYFMMQAYEYHERLLQEENPPRLTRNLIHRNREGAEERLMADYFDDHFRLDAPGRMSPSVITKCTTAIRQLAYGNTPDAFDEYLQMIENTARANNDINILDNSSLFDDLLEDIAPAVGNNMILEDQHMAVIDWHNVYANSSRNMQRTWVERCEIKRQKSKELRDRETHLSLQQNPMEHIWQEVEDQE
ncbi:hypothetical protein Tco_1472549 [Tanacetum coccineum]